METFEVGWVLEKDPGKAGDEACASDSVATRRDFIIRARDLETREDRNGQKGSGPTEKHGVVPVQATCSLFRFISPAPARHSNIGGTRWNERMLDMRQEKSDDTDVDSSEEQGGGMVVRRGERMLRREERTPESGGMVARRRELAATRSQDSMSEIKREPMLEMDVGIARTRMVDLGPEATRQRNGRSDAYGEKAASEEAAARCKVRCTSSITLANAQPDRIS
ncbi:hypothetical protein BV22DRAFT_1052310 [Leucogyrophana mollusca]|uniref:Uncharacterized protein n=1 Tax=Leucogyrophana mollusca TaxID=85980 RepID=A0ACB8AWJ1_9AGAM|nr:hypothetical protein BV22DRAFT_1052310 [Leucogyrophana mollusca]